MKYPDQLSKTNKEAATFPKISAEELENFTCHYKNGIYKELYQQKLLTDEQLNLLLKHLQEVSKK